MLKGCIMKKNLFIQRFIATKTTIRILFFFLLAACLTSCGITFIQKGRAYTPYSGEVQVFWKSHGIPANPNTYDFIGTVSGRATWCGIAAGKFTQSLHKKLIEQAGPHGGNGIILYCGEIGTTGECYCYGDIIRFR